MDLDQIMQRVTMGVGLNDILADFAALDPAAQLTNHHVMALGIYVRRMQVPPNSPQVAGLVQVINRRFVAPMFAPGPPDPNTYEPKSVVFGLDRYPPPATVRAILEPLLTKPSLEILTQLVALHGEQAIAVVAALVGRTPSDLYMEAGGREPAPTRLSRIWTMVDSIVQGTAAQPPRLGMLSPELRRPLELRDQWVPEPPERGWLRLQGYLREGLPYELMVEQRIVGTAFGTAQNASSEQVADYLSDLFLLRHARQVGLPFLRTIDGPSQPFPPYVTKEQMERLTGITPSPDIAFVKPLGQRTCEWQGEVYGGYLDMPDAYKPGRAATFGCS